MTKTLALVLTLLLAGVPARHPSPPATLDLMPVPRSLTVLDGRMQLDTTFAVAVMGYSDPRLERAVARTLDRLEHRTALRMAHTLGRDSLDRKSTRLNSSH